MEVEITVETETVDCRESPVPAASELDRLVEVEIVKIAAARKQIPRQCAKLQARRCRHEHNYYQKLVCDNNNTTCCSCSLDNFTTTTATTRLLGQLSMFNKELPRQVDNLLRAGSQLSSTTTQRHLNTIYRC